MGRRWLAVGAALALTAMGGTAGAQGLGADWRAQVTPYIWGTGLGGDLRPLGSAPTVEIDRSLSDLLRDLDAALFVSGFARLDRFVLTGDLSASRSSRAGVLSTPLAGVPASARVRHRSLTVTGGWRVTDTLDGTLDLMAGFRHWSVNGRVNVPLVGLGASASRSFTDPILAARAHLRFTPEWSALVYGDVGGFGVGSRSTSQVLGTVNYRVGPQVMVSAGYRQLAVDYRSGGSRFDLRMGGPILGATIEF
ncbi:MAG: hypothetical protein ACXIUV_11500 [Alkalilacustris sp.]